MRATDMATAFNQSHAAAACNARMHMGVWVKLGSTRKAKVG